LNSVLGEGKRIFPEYFLIRVEKYPNIIRRKIDEWIYYLQDNAILVEAK